ncbi:MAG: HAD hydrolase-like protein [Ruthenibacterium lactatiformans]
MPGRRRLYPGHRCGDRLCKKASTGRDPDAVIGKPNAYIARAAAHKYGVSLEDVCMVGDRLYTDIALGACGCGTALVLCG